MRHDHSQDDIATAIDYRKTGFWLLRLLSRKKSDLASALLLLLASTLSVLAGPVILRHAIDSDIALRDYKGLAATLILFAANSMAAALLNYFQLVKLERLAQDMLIGLKNQLLAHILRLDMNYFDTTPTGRISARVQNDIDTLHNLFAVTSVTLIRDALLFVGIFAVMASFNLRLTLVASAIIPFLAVSGYIFFKKSARHFMGIRKITSELSGFIGENVRGLSAIQSCNCEGHARGGLAALNARKLKAEYSAFTLGNIFGASFILAGPAAQSLVLGFGGSWILSDKLTIGVLIMFIMYLEQVIVPVLSFSEHLMQIQKAVAAAQRLADLLEMTPRIADPPAPAQLKAFSSAIEFKNVWLQYSDNAPYALKDVSFAIPKGAKCALIGETGGGKTSIASLLFRFYVPTKGAILIDGTDILQLSAESLRSVLGLVQQEIYIFPGTLMDNLKLMDASVPDAAVHAAIAEMGLGDFFERHSLHKEITEGGRNLSVGERQVISIIRAMVARPEILILDEATSSVDPHTERRIQRATSRLLAGRTAVIIAHRLSTITHADRILVLKDGEIKESGPHSELIKSGGLYAKYFKLQIAGPQNP